MHPHPQPPSVAKQQGEHIVGPDAPNIIIYGETGVGKSIIDLIAVRKLAHISNGAPPGGTFQHQQYIVGVGGMSYALWDTTGLEKGTESNLEVLMRGLAQSGGIHLIIYCIRATRFTMTHKRNHDLIYATVFRKKVPVALVVTGLEHQRGEMETWWSESEGVLRRHGMWFDAHACVTTLDVEDPVIRERRSASQRLLRELVVSYSKLPGWKVDSSSISRVLPKFRAVLYRTSSMGNQRNTTIMRKVHVCDMAENVPVEFSPGLTAVWDRFATHIGDGEYEFVRINKHALGSPTNVTLEDIRGVDAGLLVFYTSTLLGPHIPPTDIDALRTFYDIADGQTCPMIVVLRGCNDDEVARTCRAEVASCHSNIQAYFVSLPSVVDGTSDDAQARLDEMIERLCIEHVEIKSPHRRYTTGQKIRHMVKRASRKSW